jgi:hypothetical protein
VKDVKGWRNKRRRRREVKEGSKREGGKARAKGRGIWKKDL